MSADRGAGAALDGVVLAIVLHHGGTATDADEVAVRLRPAALPSRPSAFYVQVTAKFDPLRAERTPTAQEATDMSTTLPTPRPKLLTGWRLLVLLGVVLALLLAIGVAVLRPAPADAAVGAYPYIRHDGRCTIDVGTTSPDRARANTLANGQQVKPGYRVGKVAAPKGCILTVRSLAGTQTVTTKGIFTWVYLPRKTEGFVEVTSRR